MVQPTPPMAAPPATTSSGVPDYVLYFKSGCVTCDRLLQKIDRFGPLPNVYLQNILMLTQRPPWLDGVPILADTHLGMIYRGSDALIFLDKLIDVEGDPEKKKKKKTTNNNKNRNMKRPGEEPSPEPLFQPSTQPPTQPKSKPKPKPQGLDALFALDEGVADEEPGADLRQAKLDENLLTDLIAKRASQIPTSDARQLQ